VKSTPDDVSALPSPAEVRAAAAESIMLAAACLISYWLTTRALSLVYSVGQEDDALGGMWAVIATVFVSRHSYDKSLVAAVSRMSATLVSFALCLAYLAFLPFRPWGLAILVSLSVLVMALVGRPQDAITAGITTAVVMVVAKLSPYEAWQQPIHRLADTAIGVAVGTAAVWLGLVARLLVAAPPSPRSYGMDRGCMAAEHEAMRALQPGSERKEATQIMTVKPDQLGIENLLPSSLHLELHGDIAVLRLTRAAKRNALDQATVLGMETFFNTPPTGAKVVILDAEGDHFSAGADLSEVAGRDPFATLKYSMMWHRAFEHIERGHIPVISILKGAVIGGGLELAAATHIRVAEPTAFYALPEGQRGIFVGGGASVRVPRLIGTHRMMDMMLTGRVVNVQEGHAWGLSHYLTGSGEGLARAMELADAIVENSALTNFAVLQALPHIVETNSASGYLFESLMAAVANSHDDAQERIRAFLEGRAAKVRPDGTRGGH
jgi:(methylthio)acryloyl-CoA hydratase